MCFNIAECGVKGFSWVPGSSESLSTRWRQCGPCKNHSYINRFILVAQSVCLSPQQEKHVWLDNHERKKNYELKANNYNYPKLIFYWHLHHACQFATRLKNVFLIDFMIFIGQSWSTFKDVFMACARCINMLSFNLALDSLHYWHSWIWRVLI